MKHACDQDFMPGCLKKSKIVVAHCCETCAEVMDKYPGKLVESKISLVMEKHPDKLELISTLGETKKNAQPYWYYSSVSESCFGDILISESDDSKRMDAWLLRLSFSQDTLYSNCLPLIKMLPALGFRTLLS